MSGTKRLLPLYAFVAGTRKSLPCPLQNVSRLTSQAVRRFVVRVICHEMCVCGGGGDSILPDPVRGSPCNSSVDIQ
jgi:hypothetical protein